MRGSFTPRGAGLKGIPFTTKGIPFETSGIPFTASGIPFTTKGIPFTASGIPFTTKGIPFTAKGIPFMTKGIPFSRPFHPDYPAENTVLYTKTPPKHPKTPDLPVKRRPFMGNKYWLGDTREAVLALAWTWNAKLPLLAAKTGMDTAYLQKLTDDLMEAEASFRQATPENRSKVVTARMNETFGKLENTMTYIKDHWLNMPPLTKTEWTEIGLDPPD
ncbi:MAG: hypothetical protein LBD24_01110, partial [Spirochaetaceae bacterium]|nr:hypothetical protein [Spirochaetaceae bacterium]